LSLSPESGAERVFLAILLSPEKGGKSFREHETRLGAWRVFFVLLLSMSMAKGTARIVQKEE
jgi:hypothetical protein